MVLVHFSTTSYSMLPDLLVILSRRCPRGDKSINPFSLFLTLLSNQFTSYGHLYGRPTARMVEDMQQAFRYEYPIKQYLTVQNI